MKERVKRIREQLGLNQREFSKKIKVSQPALAMMENGQREVRDIHVSLICSVFNVNEEWLRNGIGDMFISDDDLSLDEYANLHGVTAEQRELFKALMSISPEERMKFVDRCRAIFAKFEQAAAAEKDKAKKLREYERELDAEKNTQTSLASQVEGDDDEETA